MGTIIVHAQFVYKIKADSVLITNDSCRAELNLENKTKDTIGFLYNKGNGRTEFRRGAIKINDTTYLVGGDTIITGGSGSTGNYILNQYSYAQPAIFWISEGAQIGGSNFQLYGKKLVVYNGLGVFKDDLNDQVNINGDQGKITFSNALGQKIVLYADGGNKSDYDYYGFGLAGGILEYNLNSTLNSHVFYSANSTTSRNELFRIKGSGGVVVSNLSGDPSGSNGMLYYNTTTNRFKGFGNSSWQDIISSGNIGSGLVYNNNKLELGGVGVPETSPNGHLTRDTWINTYDQADSQSRVFGILTAPSAWVSDAAMTWLKDGVVINSTYNPYFIHHGGETLVKIGSFNIQTGVRDQPYGAYTPGHNQSYGGIGVDINMPIAGANSHTIGQSIEVVGDNHFKGTGMRIRTANFTNNEELIYAHETVALRLTATAPNSTSYRIRTYAIYADSGRVYSRDSVMFGTTTPAAFFHVNGTSRFDLGSDATGDIFYRNSSGLFTRLPIGSSGQVLTVNSGLPAWATSSGGGGSDWSLTGNSGTNPSTNFLGTIDAQRLVFRTNNTEKATIDTTGKVGIATSSPQYKLDVNGDARINTLPFLANRDTVLTYDPSTKQVKVTSLPEKIKITSDLSQTSSTSLIDATGLSFNVTSGTYYHFKFIVIFRSSNTNNGITLSISHPGATIFSASAQIPVAGDGVGGEFQGTITASNDAVIGSGVQTTNTDYVAVVEGLILPSTTGTLKLRYASELGSANIIIKQASFGTMEVY